MEHYFLIKHLHMTTAGLSLAFFILRAWWSVREAPILQRRWVKVVPHVNDTLLLTFGILLMVMLSMWPQHHPWLAAKILALLVYIVLGTVAIKRGRTPLARGGAAVAAVVTFLYMLGTAVFKDPLWFVMM
ncbi:SirB2 family protein [Billgrantia montanilacus]|uniref:Regulator SirB n=1 Tax=Billgrantia montanilacus TaxID=2282305 RepID=A0A368TWB0_9GAMM|nr:SirB2 family protein [Halomonas montanilacus]RCV88984.1 regulator SirB [Halomonas montanilacus]